MKDTLRIVLCIAALCTFAAAQQNRELKNQPPAIQPTAESLMKALAAADKAQGHKDEQSVEELKKTIEREIARSVSQPVAIPMEETTPEPSPDRLVQSVEEFRILPLIDGKLYIKLGDSILPLVGAGARGCFSIPAKIEKAMANLAAGKKAGTARQVPNKKE